MSMFGGRGRENETLGRLTQMMMPAPVHIDPTAAIGGGGDGDFPKRDERVLQWSQQETKDFIGIRADLERDFNVSKRNKSLWEVVGIKMKERGYRRSPDQCKCKWKNLVNRYKGKETSDMDSSRQCPFFDELHAVFTERANNMQRLSEAGSGQGKKRAKRISMDNSSEDLSLDEHDDEYESEEATRSTNPRKRKGGRETKLPTPALEKPSKQSLPTNTNNNSTSNQTSLQEMLRELIQQQQRIDMEWRESMEKRAYERQLFEREWRQSMEKLERERMMIEHTWKEKEEARRIRDESRAEKRDALLNTLLNQLIQENHD